jgi:Mg-chelatase subunit ChlD
MHTRIFLALALLLGATFAKDEKKIVAPERRTIDLAICLDTSGSMNGLIDSCRQKIWAIINDLALAKPTPRLRVALLSYGNDGYAKDAGWVRLDTGFTDDLDRVSQQLFALRTGGGTELVGRVMQAALARLDWSKDSKALRIMIVAGNESADQDKEVSFRLMCRRAIGRDIMVNPIYCTRSENVAHEWKEIARLTDGHYAAIDQNRGTVTIATPFDGKLKSLSGTLNTTYIAFAGKQGREGRLNQEAQDRNAAGLNADAAVLRSTAKAQVLYYCSWCLVDTTRNKAVKLEDIKLEDLPENMRKMTMEQRKGYVDGMYTKRVAIQKQIKELNAKRNVFIAADMAKRNQKDDNSFDAAVRRAIREQAKSKGFSW